MIQRFRIGNNLSIIWLLYEDDGNIHNLEGKEIELYMVCGGYKHPVTDYTITENAIAWTFPAAIQTRTGYYKLVLLERDATRGLYSFDVAQAFCLEPRSALRNIKTIVDEDATVQVRSVLTYAHITNLASVDTVQTEEGSAAVIRLTNGKYFTIPLGGGGGGTDISVVDNLNSTSPTDALSANQGHILKELIDSLPQLNVEDNLESVSKTNPLSANMGRELKRLIDSIEPGGGGGGYTLPVAGSGAQGQLGGVRVGSGLSIDPVTGLLSASGGGGGGSTGDQAQMMFSSEDNPGTPATDPGSWHPAQTAGDVWMAIRIKNNDTWGEWAVVFIGDIVVPYATFKAFAFTRSNAASVSAPTGGSYASPVPTTSGWSDGIPSGTGKIWMSTRIFASDDTHSEVAWSTPREVADSEFMDYEFSSVANPGTPNKANPSAQETNPNWSNTATESTIWMAMREVSNGLYKTGSSWMIVKIKGEDGKDGTSVSIKGTVDLVGELPSSGNEEGDGYILTTNGHLYVWDGDSWVDCGQIKGDPGADGQTPYLHIKYSNDGGLHFTGNDGEDPGDFIGLYWDYTAEDSDDVTDYTWKGWKGEDGFGYEYIFKLTANSTAPSLPSTSPNTDDYVPTGWTDDPGGVSSEYPFCWVAWRKKVDGTWSSWIGTTNNKARLYSHYGKDGEDGGAGQAQFKSIVFKRSATQPSRPGNGTTPGSSSYGGTFNNPVPYGWSDGIPALVSVDNPDSLDNTLWMTSRVFTDDAQSPQEADWKTPVQAFDTEGYDIEYAYMQTNDARPADPTTANRHGGSGTQLWFDPVLDKYTTGTTQRDFTEMYWMAMRAKVNGTGVGGWTVLRIKGENGTPGVDGKDAKPVRIRKWVDIAGQSLSGNQRVFSGYEDGAPFRDVIVITKDVYPNGTVYPWMDGNNALPILAVVNYSSNYETGYPGSYFTNSRLPQSGNYSNNLPANKTESASASALGTIYAVFANLGPIYTQLLVAMQAYIGSLTVDHLTTNAGNNSYIAIDDGLICFYDDNGNLRIKMGQESGDTTPVLKFYDTDGETVLYDLGPAGIYNASGPIELPEWTRYKAVMKSSSGGSFVGGETITPSSAVNIYKFEAGKRYVEYPSGSGNYVIQYMSPFDPNDFSGNRPDIDGDYFNQYLENIDPVTYGTHLMPIGEYIIMPISEDRTTGIISAPAMKITSVGGSRNVSTNWIATFTQSGDNYILQQITRPLL